MVMDDEALDEHNHNHHHHQRHRLLSPSDCTQANVLARVWPIENAFLRLRRLAKVLRKISNGFIESQSLAVFLF